MTKIKVALAQINPLTGDLERNLKKIVDEIEYAKTENADLIIFPEMALTGYCISDLMEDNTFLKANKKTLEKIISHTEGITAVVGFVDYDENKINGDGRIKKFNAAAVTSNGKIAGISHKTLLPNYRYFDDKRYFSPSETREPIEVNLGKRKLKLGISICEDMWDDNYGIKPIKELSDKGADLIININASPFSPNKFNERYDLIKRHIAYTGKPLIYLNTVGSADNGKNIIPFDGQSIFCDKKGNIISLGEQFEEEVIFVNADLDDIVNGLEVKLSEKEEQIYNAIVMSLRDYARKTGFRRAIVPTSGGIDSALGLAITAEAFGKENVVAYNLPSIYNTEITKSIAERLAKNLGVEYKIIPIQEIDEKILCVFEENDHTIEKKVTRENLHARIRGMLMMMESNDSGELLISNGNETEIALGYSTLYGDMCGGISIIGDLSKVDVYRISEYVNRRFGREIIPKETFTIRSSAELSEGQYDPFDYYVTAPLVTEFSEKRKGPAEVVELFKQKKLEEDIFIHDREGKTVYDKHNEESFEKLAYETYNLMKRSVYKRVQAPPIIAVSERAFGYDLRETLSNGWRGRL